MGVDTLLKGSSSSKLAGQLQGIVKSEPVEVTAKAESFGRAMESARRIVESSESPKSLKSSTKSNASGKQVSKEAAKEKATDKASTVVAEAKKDSVVKGKGKVGKTSLTKADPATYEAKAVAQEPTRAHKIAESVKGTLERLAVKNQSKSASGVVKEQKESKKSQKSTISKNLGSTAKLPTHSVESSKSDATTEASPKKVDAELSKVAVINKADEKQAASVVEDKKKSPSLKNTKTPSTQAGPATLVSKKEMVSADSTKNEEPNVVVSADEVPAATLVEKSEVEGEGLRDERTVVTKGADAQVHAVSSNDVDDLKDEPVSISPEGALTAESQNKGHPVALKVESVDAEQPMVVTVEHPVAAVADDQVTTTKSLEGGAGVAAAEKVAVALGSAAMASSVKAAQGNDKRDTKVDRRPEVSSKNEVDAVRVSVKDDAVTVKETKPAKSVVAKNEVALGHKAAPARTDAQMEAKASEHLYRAVNKLPSGLGSGVITKTKAQPKAVKTAKVAHVAHVAKEERQDVKGAVTAKVVTEGAKVSANQQVKAPAKPSAESTNNQVKVQEQAVSERKVAPSVNQAKVAAPAAQKTSSANTVQDSKKPEVVTSNVKAEAPKQARSESLGEGRSLNLGARDSMTFETSLIGSRLFGKRGAEKQPVTYRNTKLAQPPVVAREKVTTAQKVRSTQRAKLGRAAVPNLQPAAGTDATAMAATSARVETAAPEAATVKKTSSTTTATQAENSVKSDNGESLTAKNGDVSQEREQSKEQGKRSDNNRHFETKKQVEAEVRAKEEALDDLQEASDVEIADEVAQVKQTTAANKLMAKEGGKTIVNPLKDLSDTPRNAAVVSERREVHEQILAKNLGRNLGRIASMGTTHAKLRLNPQEFGRVDVEIRTRDGEVTLLVRTETVSAAAELNSQMNDLRASMKEHGLNLADCDVDSRGFGAEDREADGSREGRDGDGRGRGDQDNREGRGNRRRRGRGQRIKRSAIDVVV